MRSQSQKWFVAGIASLGLLSTGAAFGEASDPDTPSSAGSGQSSLQPVPMVSESAPRYPRGVAAYPQGKQTLGATGTNASPQYGPIATPYGAINQGSPGFLPGPSGQIGAAPSGIYGLAPGQVGQPRPGAAPMTAAPGEFGPGTGQAGAGMGAAGGTAGAITGPPGGPAVGPGAGAAAAAAGLPEGVLAGLGGEVGAGEAANFPPNMIGDMSPFGAVPLQSSGSVGPPGPQGRGASSSFFPSVRAFKISENMSPRPQDRFFFDVNYYNNVNSQINSYDRIPIYHMQAFRYMFGFEKTFNDGKGSFGMRLPIDNLTADSLPGVKNTPTPTRTAMGNLDLFAKYVLEQDPKSGSLLSVGMLLSTPTGPGRFAGAPYVHGLNDLSFQPFMGYIWNGGDWYIQGFSGFYFPTILSDLTYMYNDIGVGYYLLRSADPSAFLTAVVPTFEVHVNSPFTHTDWHNRLDFAAAPTVVNLTYGVNFQLQRSAILTAAFVQPVTSPQPFSSEVAIFLNIFYGRSRAGTIPIQPPPL
jgi:hypothetical protein